MSKHVRADVVVEQLPDASLEVLWERPNHSTSRLWKGHDRDIAFAVRDAAKKIITHLSEDGFRLTQTLSSKEDE